MSASACVTRPREQTVSIDAGLVDDRREVDRFTQLVGEVELIGRPIDRRPIRQFEPAVHVDGLTVVDHVGDPHLAADVVTHDQRGHRGLTETRDVDRPVLRVVARVVSPRCRDGGAESVEIHRTDARDRARGSDR